MNVNHTVELQCEVPRGTTVQWSINTHPIYPEEHPNIFINTTTDGSVLRVGDEGLDTFGTVQGSAVLHIECTAVNYSNRTRTVGKKGRNIVRFGKYSHATLIAMDIINITSYLLAEIPDSPRNITVSLRSDIFWERPENMVDRVPLTYNIVMQDLATGTEFNKVYHNVAVISHT